MAREKKYRQCSFSASRNCWKAGRGYEVKLDGYRMQALKDGDCLAVPFPEWR
jgi:ATP-dependent DNA ligase